MEPRNWTRRDFLRATGLGGLAACLNPAAKPRGALAAEGRRPSFLFILVDDLGASDLGCYGNTFHETPSVDRLAREGIRFTDAYAAAPVSSPTRASIMTGKYPARLGITDWIPGENQPPNRAVLCHRTKRFMPLEEVTVAEALKEQGYATAFVGKWHLGYRTKKKRGAGVFYPDKQGFDVNIAGNYKGRPHKGYFSPYDLANLEDGPKGEYLTDRLTDEAIALLDRFKREGRPFLLFMSFYSVHTPIQAKREDIGFYERKRPRGPWKNAKYAAMVGSMDRSVGRILGKLTESGLDRNTAVIFYSDNGGHRVTSNHPHRGWKGQIYEGGIRVPLVVKWPGVTRPGGVSRVPVTSTDFYPTILEMAGAPLKPDQHVDGVSLVRLLGAERSLDRRSLDRQAIYWHFPHFRRNAPKMPAGAVRSGEFKLIEFYATGEVELYDLGRDVGERRDLSKQAPGKAAGLKKMLAEWREATGAVMPRPNPQHG